MTGVERAYKYCEDVEKKNILTNSYVKLAVKRFRKDLKNSKSKDYPYRFNEDKANKFIAFTEYLKQYNDKFKGKNLILENWQCFIFANIYGWEHKETKVRRFRKAFVFVGRKNGKSTMIAPTLLYDILTTSGAQCFTLATKREQAKLVYQVCLEMIKQNEGLSKRLKVYNSTNRVINNSNSGYLEPLSADADKLDGLNPSVAVIDELSAQKNMDLVKIISSGQGARPEPLLLEITSGSDDLYSAGHQEFDRTKRVLEGVVEDDTFFGILYCLDDNDSWHNEEVYIKANPNLGISVSRDFLHNQRIEAEQQPSMEGEFRTKNLCQWVNPISVWIPYRTWTKSLENATKYKLDKYDICIGSIDLSEKYDFTCFTLCFYNLKENRFYFKHRFYIPESQIKEKMKTDSEMVIKWVEQGYIVATRGNIVDYNYMLEDIKKDMREYNIQEILYDPYNSNSLITDLSELIDTVEITQSTKNISPYAKEYEASVINGEVVDNNPVLSWMVSNCAVYKDANGNIKPVKDNSTGGVKRIDGVITSLMALGRIKALVNEGYIDSRTPEQAYQETTDFLSKLNF